MRVQPLITLVFIFLLLFIISLQLFQIIEDRQKVFRWLERFPRAGIHQFQNIYLMRKSNFLAKWECYRKRSKKWTNCLENFIHFAISTWTIRVSKPGLVVLGGGHTSIVVAHIGSSYLVNVWWVTGHLVPDKNYAFCGEMELTCEKLFSNKAEFDKSQTDGRSVL